MGTGYLSSMAGNSAKKNAKANAETLTWRFNVLVAINVIFLVYRVIYHNDSFGFWSWVSLCVAWEIYALCYSNFKASAASSLHNIKEVGEYWSDVFMVTLAAHTVAIYTNFGWLVMLVIPAYLIGNGVVSWAAAEDPMAAQKEAEDAKESKKAQRKVKTKASNNHVR